VHLEGKIIDVLEKIDGKFIIDAAANVPDSPLLLVILISRQVRIRTIGLIQNWSNLLLGDIAQQLSSCLSS
jgi:hypothetical protein